MISNSKKLNANLEKKILMYITARQFKNAIPIEEMMIIPALKNGFAENTILCFGDTVSFTARGNKIICKHFPFLVNKAFACEVYLKFLLIEYNINISDLKGKEGHNLLKLYKKLPRELQENFLNSMYNKGILSEDQLVKELQNISQTFVEWRYIYEKNEHSTNYGFLNYFCNFLDGLCDNILLERYNYNVSLDMR